jgi:DNA-binding PadR family transcriptional regulator
MVEWDPPHRLAWDGPPLPWAGGGARPRGSYSLTEAGKGRTLLVSRYEPELLGTLVLLRPYFKWWLRRQRTKDAQTLKAALEEARA